MSANKLNQTKYNNAANNTVLDAVIDPVALLAWRQDVKAVADQHADEINLSQDSVGVKRQSIINGNFSVNQLTKTGTVTLAAGAYGHDQWKAGAAGCTYTFATVNNVTTITITAGSLVQVIEGINLYSGTYTLTWTGTAQGKIGAGAYGTTGIMGVVTGGANLSIEFNVGTISQVQFNFGSSAVPFQPRSFAEELALCLRYYEKSFNYSTAPVDISSYTGGVSRAAIGVNASATNINCEIPFRVEKRVSPTMTFFSAQGGGNTAGKWSSFDTTDHFNLTPTGFPTTSKLAVNLTGSGLTPGQACELQGNWTADARI